MGVFSPNIPVPSLDAGYASYTPMLNLWLLPLHSQMVTTLPSRCSCLLFFFIQPHPSTPPNAVPACGLWFLSSDCLRPAASVWLVSPPNPHLFGWLVTYSYQSTLLYFPILFLNTLLLASTGFWFIFFNHQNKIEI